MGMKFDKVYGVRVLVPGRCVGYSVDSLRFPIPDPPDRPAPRSLSAPLPRPDAIPSMDPEKRRFPVPSQVSLPAPR
jgi:hypothetical protein